MKQFFQNQHDEIQNTPWWKNYECKIYNEVGWQIVYANIFHSWSIINISYFFLYPNDDKWMVISSLATLTSNGTLIKENV